ncbi:MAG: Arylsulfatase [Verrucomicrobia subdivision 3 bacterium]|nr:Arylsulfatase [Limisphaerales bacterium]MCS1417326.1 Arylsulfatase [Limisphaerales bacterium]
MPKMFLYLFITLLHFSGTLAAASQPNIVLILADDLGFGDLSCNNPQSQIQTPVLDQLANEGINFVDAHSPSGVCTPTRYGVLTGRYCWRTRLKRGVLSGRSEPLIEPDRLTLPAMLKEVGYQTGQFGKWHLGRLWPLKNPQGKIEPLNIDWSKPALYCPLDAGFTYTFGLARPAWAFMENRHVLIEPTEPFDRTHIPPHIIGPNNNQGFQQPGFTFEQMIPAWVKKTSAFIQRNARARKPFFVYFAPICPHRPINPNQEFQGKSGCGVFGDFVIELDTAVGSILDQLNRSGVAENTLVIFTADNGAETNTYGHIETYDHWSSAGRRGCKRDLYEGGHRVPFIARWPGQIAPGSVSDEIICLTDLMATVAAIVGYDLLPEAAEDSYNILPALCSEKRASPIREATVHHSAHGRFAIRQGDWVYINAPTGADNREPQSVLDALGVKPHNHAAELFNLRTDPNQTTNRITTNAEKAKALKALLERYRTGNSSRPR